MTLAPTNWKSLAQSMGVRGWLAVGAVVGVGIVLARDLPPLISALALPSSVAAEGVGASQERAEQFRAEFDRHVSQVNGRSMFFTPGPPRKPRPAEEKPKVAEESAPSVYGGPRILAMINDKVWFEDATSAELGAGESRGLRVVAINAPWSARVAWRGVEFDVPLFDRTTGRFLEPPSGAPSPIAEPRAEAPAASPVSEAAPAEAAPTPGAETKSENPPPSAPPPGAGEGGGEGAPPGAGEAR